MDSTGVASSESFQTPSGNNAPAIKIKTWHVAVFFLLLTALMFSHLLLGNAYPWDDLLGQEIPYRMFAGYCLQHGIFPLWNPYSYCGMPFFADLQTAVLYPTNLIVSFLINAESFGSWLIEFFIIVHYWLAAFGMFFLCRNELKQSTYGAIIGGIVYGYSGIMITQEIHQMMIFQFAWLPWVFFTIMRGTRTGKTTWFIFWRVTARNIVACWTSPNSTLQFSGVGRARRYAYYS